MAERFDAVVIGAGPAGEVAVTKLSEQGLRVALVERELIGGECAYWGCIPSKTLIRPPEVRAEARRAAGVNEPATDWSEVADYRDFMIRNLDDSKQKKGYEESGVAVYRGAGTIAGTGRVEVGDDLLETDRIVVATGSDAAIPPIDGLDGAGYWTNREATTESELPESLAVVGGGAIGVEMAQMFRRFGVVVTVIEDAERVMAREDPRVGELTDELLRDDGVEVRTGVRAVRVSRENGTRRIELDDGQTVTAAELLVATGRRARVDGIGLDKVGIEPGKDGIDVDERCRAADGVWAIGDVTGVLPFTHVGKYQARIAAADIAGRDVRADYRAIPRVVFADPEIAAVGQTSAQAREDGIDVATSRVKLADEIARPWTYERDPGGELELVADRAKRVLVGAWAVAPLASEWIHQAALAIKAELSIELLLDSVQQFPTFSESYLKGLEALEL